MRRLLVVLGIASSLGVAIPAHADPNADASFLEAVKQAEITFSDSNSAVTAGKTVCEFLDQGKSMADVVALVMQQNSAISNVSAAKFTAIAASAYCPQYLHRVSDNGGSQTQPSPNRVGTSAGG
jgi:Protein of unknown function (DUF732)